MWESLENRRMAFSTNLPYVEKRLSSGASGINVRRTRTGQCWFGSADCLNGLFTLLMRKERGRVKWAPLRGRDDVFGSVLSMGVRIPVVQAAGRRDSLEFTCVAFHVGRR